MSFTELYEQLMEAVPVACRECTPPRRIAINLTNRVEDPADGMEMNDARSELSAAMKVQCPVGGLAVGSCAGNFKECGFDNPTVQAAVLEQELTLSPEKLEA